MNTSGAMAAATIAEGLQITITPSSSRIELELSITALPRGTDAQPTRIVVKNKITYRVFI
jgi:hypothetical protein